MNKEIKCLEEHDKPAYKTRMEGSTGLNKIGIVRIHSSFAATEINCFSGVCVRTSKGLVPNSSFVMSLQFFLPAPPAHTD